MMKDVVFFDTEIGIEDKRIHDIGAMRNRVPFHSVKLSDFLEFISGAEFICGHNIIHHDLKYLPDSLSSFTAIDTLYLSPLLFPCRPYHRLLKDDKLQSDQLNNPLNDAQKAAELFYDEVNTFWDLYNKIKQVY